MITITIADTQHKEKTFVTEVPSWLWAGAYDLAKLENTSLPQLVRRALKRYIANGRMAPVVRIPA